MPSIRIRGDYRFRTFINLIVFKIAYTKTGTVDREFDMPVGHHFTKTLPLPGPFDVEVSLSEEAFTPGGKLYARAIVHMDGQPSLKFFDWAKEIDVKTSVPVAVNDLRNGNHFHGAIEFKL
jgi:hypothetical protein